MKSIKAKIFTTLNNDTTIRSLLGLPALSIDPITHLVIPAIPSDAGKKIRWLNLPSNPIYPCIVFRKISSRNELRFKNFKSAISEVYFEVYIFTDLPSTEVIDDVKDRITILFQDSQDTLSDTYMMYYLSEVTDDAGDSFQDEDNRFFTTMRLRFKVQKVQDILNNK